MISTQACTQVVEKVGYLVGIGSLRTQVRHLRGSGGMLPQENFGFLDLLRWFLVQFWSNKALLTSKLLRDLF